MGPWVGGGRTYPHASERDGYSGSVKRRLSVGEDGFGGRHMDWPKRPRLDDWRDAMRHHRDFPYIDKPHHAVVSHHSPHSLPSHYRGGNGSAPPCQQGVNASLTVTHPRQEGSVTTRNIAFVVIREHAEPPPRGHSEPLEPCSMERTQSGLSIASESATTCVSEEEQEFESRNFGPLLSDLGAARLVRSHIAGYRSDSQSARILRSLINPKSRDLDRLPLDDEAMINIFSTANELFFANRLKKRVAWDWSHQSASQYANHIVGTTALRRSACLGGYETLIVLSSPILKNDQFNRRLLISTFLHEMIHCFLFVTCGVKARKNGGHTEGFHQIAQIIDDWAGRDNLRLSEMDADLEWFRDNIDNPPQTSVPSHQHQCNDHHQQPYVKSPEPYARFTPPMYDVPPPGRCEGQTRWRPCDRADYLDAPRAWPAAVPHTI